MFPENPSDAPPDDEPEPVLLAAVGAAAFVAVSELEELSAEAGVGVAVETLWICSPAVFVGTRFDRIFSGLPSF
jgi:hypothetical protein